MLYIFIQWVANPVNDMYADAIVAAILQADLLEGPVKNITTSAKVDRMHFKVSARPTKHTIIFIFVNHFLLMC